MTFWDGMAIGSCIATAIMLAGFYLIERRQRARDRKLRTVITHRADVRTRGSAEETAARIRAFMGGPEVVTWKEWKK